MAFENTIEKSKPYKNTDLRTSGANVGPASNKDLRWVTGQGGDGGKD